MFDRIKALTYRAGLAATPQAAVESFLAEARELAANGLTLAEVGQLFLSLVMLAVDAARWMQSVPGSEKKAFVLSAVGLLFDVIAPAIPVPMFVQPFRALLRPYLRVIVLALAGGAIEALLNRQP